MTRKCLNEYELVEGVHYRIPRSKFSGNADRIEQRETQENLIMNEDLTFEALSQTIVSTAISDTQSTTNIASAVKQFVADLGMKMSDIVGPIFRGAYYQRLDEHLSRLLEAGRSSAYVSNRKHLLKKARLIVLKLDRQSAIANGKETPLGAALASLVESAEDLPGLCRHLHISHRRIEAYIRGGTPGRGAEATLRKLEQHFAMTAGALTDLLPQGVPKPHWTRSGKRVRGAVITKSQFTTAYRRRVAQARKDPYLLRPEEITEDFRQTWRDYLAYKTDPWQAALNTSGKPRKLSCWRCIEIVDKRPGLWDWVSEVNGQWCPTARHQFFITSSYLGWLRKPTSWGGGGVDTDSAINLGWFADVEKVRANMEWRKRRAGNVINGSVWKMLVHAAALCQPERGFLWRSKLIGRNFGFTTLAAWQEHCAESFATYRQLMKIIERDIKKSRDPFESIKDIIAMDRPLDAVFDAIDRMDQDRPPPGGEAELVWARNRLLLSLLASNPLRARNLKELTWREDNSGSLRRDPDGNYRIFLCSAQLKNHTGAGKLDYDVLIQPDLTKFIDKYLSDYLPRLSKGLTDRVFVQTLHPERRWEWLNETFRELTKRYFVNSPGFGPHCMRHIVATALIKLHGSFTAAAKVLHDLETTVRKHYGFLIGDDGARWVGDLWRRSDDKDKIR